MLGIEICTVQTIAKKLVVVKLVKPHLIKAVV